VLAVADLLGVDTVDGQQLVLCGLGTVTVVLIGLLGRAVGGAAVGLTAAVVAAGYPMLFSSDAVLMPETPFALLVTAALLLAVRARAHPTPGGFAVVGAVVGLAALTRAEGLLLAPLLLVPLAVRVPRTDGRRRLVLAGAGLAAAAMVVAPWTLRNAARFDGALVPVSNNLGTALDGANCDKTWFTAQTGLWLYECFGGFDLSDQDEAEAAAFHRRRGLQYVADHPGRLPVVLLVREARTFGVHDVDRQVRIESLEGRTVRWQTIGTRTWWVLAVLAAGGLATLVRRRAVVWPLVSTLVLVVVTTAVTYGNQRFRVAAEPAVVVLAAVALVALSDAVRRRGPTSRGATTPDRGAPARAR
jgi:4-amino-4-deoxy-L-arabinose transferase-like glycosyltransferase